jgi:uncharacterized protein with von Willebrand factor type A (vWA) domain
MDGNRLAVSFAATARAAGLDVPVGSVVAYAEALGAVGLAERGPVYWAGRATLVRRPEDAPRYDQAFAVFWLGREAVGAAAPVPQRVAVETDDADGDDARLQPGASGPVMRVRWSPVETLRAKDFAAYSHEEFAEARRLMADLRLAGALRRSRRLARSLSRRGQPDVRATVRRSLRAGGEPAPPVRRGPRVRPRRVVLLCDVSGSMAPYTRALMRFAHAAVAGRVQVEVFALGTRLTRVTRELSSHDPDAALAAAGRAVADWSGGTRLGHGLREFNDRWGVRGMARQAVVVILSDGWDRGDPALLAEQMARLRRVAHRVVWVNPLKASAGYAPLARGMAAALPYVDEFVEGHSLASIEALAEVVAR